MQTYSIKCFSLGFWLIQLPWMFISSCTIVLFYFFSNAYISVNTIFECSYLFFGWEIGRGMKGVHPKCVQCVQVRKGTGVEKWVIRYVRTTWMAPNNVFLSTGSAKYTRASERARKMWLFSSIITTIILSYVIIRI